MPFFCNLHIKPLGFSFFFFPLFLVEGRLTSYW